MSDARKFVPLDNLVDEEVMRLVDDFDLSSFEQISTVRGQDLGWLCLSRRLLWMAYGHEYIEPELLDWIDGLPKGAVLFDIGASNGIFALYAAARGASVTAFEPDPTNYFLLAFNNYINSRLYGVAVDACLNVAISDCAGLGVLQIDKMEVGAHRKILDKKTDVYGEPFRPDYSHKVLKMPIDHLIDSYDLPQPSHLKIDVDGSEAEVLSGMENSLTHVESVFIELTEQFLRESATDVFRASGLALKKTSPVQNYPDLHNCIFSRA